MSLLRRDERGGSVGAVTRKSISIFFPVLNEEGTVARLAEDFLAIIRSSFDRGELIIVDDGSTDRSREIADQLAQENEGYVRVIHHEQSRGYGNALKAGFEAARHELVFFTDGDYQFDVNDLYEALPHIEEYDVVVGYRQDRQDPKYRLLLSRGYNGLVRILFGLKIRDVDCSFKLFRREALEKISIESTGYFIDTEIMVKGKKEGLRIREIGVRHLPRTSGVSKVKMKHIFTTLREIFALWNSVRSA
jgi:glycosyltransferase involved in cell wall biosynthesis